MDLFKMTELVPVSEWKYYRYEVSFWRREPQEGDKPIKVQRVVSTDTHLEGKVHEQANLIHPCEWVSWECLGDAPRPRVIGQIYGHPIYHDGWE